MCAAGQVGSKTNETADKTDSTEIQTDNPNTDTNSIDECEDVIGDEVDGNGQI